MVLFDVTEYGTDFSISFSICSLWDMEIQLNSISTDLAKFYIILFNDNRHFVTLEYTSVSRKEPEL